MSAKANIPRIQIPAVFAPVWTSTKPYQIWYGSRYSSKSWTKAIYFLLKAQSQRYFRGVFARDTQKNVRLAQYQLFKDLCKRFDVFRDRYTFHNTTMTVTCKANGNFMVGGSFEQPDSLRSVADPTDFWAEEPVTRESQIARQDFLDIVGSLRNAEGVPVQFHFTFNPISKKTWIYEDFFLNDLYAGKVETLRVNYDQNPYCPQSAREFLESLKVIDPKRYQVDGLGEWGVDYEGLIYPEWEPVDEMPPPQFYGVDFGWTAPTAIVAGAVRDVYGQDRQSLLVSEVVYRSRLDAPELIAELNAAGVRRDVPMICDNEEPRMIQALRQAGFLAIPCTKGVGSVRDGIKAVQAYNLKVVRGSRNLIDELSTYVWKKKLESLIDIPDAGMDHAMDAMRYGVESLGRTASGSEEFNDW